MSVAFSFSLSNEGPNIIRRHLTRPDEEQYASFLQEIAVSPAVVSRRCIVSEFSAVHRGPLVEQWLERQTTLKVVPWSFSSPDFTASTEFTTGLVSCSFSLILPLVYKVFHVIVFHLTGRVYEYDASKVYYYCNRRRRLGSSAGFVGLVGMPYFDLWIHFSRAGRIQRYARSPRRSLKASWTRSKHFIFF